MRILFIGNSHTSRNDLPGLVRALVDSASGRPECEAALCAADGRDLAWHAAEGGTRLALAGNRWDFVALQQKTHPFDGYAALAAGCAALEPGIRAAGARALIYSTWKRKDAPESDQDELDAAHARLAGESGALLVPAGAAWSLVRRGHPEIELYDADGAHAAPAGTYLTACAFFRALTGKSPLGLPARIEANGTLLADLPPDAAGTLQRAAAGV
ncbi:MAG TPA: hypothetical protein PK280_06820 [Planctomycetota bacterium]|nr:hypothetical protein [Planctomycetota bacterium]